ncbi:MAG: DUF255 domain-containing protein [Nitrospirota bacterium]
MEDGTVRWRQWGAEAFDEARDSNKLILLDISAVWCHWCHVMDDTSYSSPEVINLLNGRFIPIRVDTDRMPDVNERYNMGGWPTTAVLTPTGEVLVGATYVPPEKLVETLRDIDEFYAKNRDAVHEKAAELSARKADEIKTALESPKGELSENIAAYVLEELDRNYDPVHGGFGIDPKFPLPDAVDLLLTAYRDTGRNDYLEMAAKTLDGMSSYGMYDHVMGGFFRYSTTRDWSVPHYEKMLDGNAGLIVNLINTWRVTGDEKFINTARKTLDYVDGWLWADDGYFCGSQDADEVYYKLGMEERKKRQPPSADRTMYTSFNSRMAFAYLTAWEAMGEPGYKERALMALDFILSKMKCVDGGLCHYYDSGPKRPGLLTDNSGAIKALLLAFQLTGDKKWLDEALLLEVYLESTHWDFDHGGYFDTARDPGAIAALTHRVKPMAENSDMSHSLKTLGIITGEKKFQDMAQKCLLPFTRSYRDLSFMAAGYALAVDFHMKPAVELTLAGRFGGADMTALTKAVNRVFLPRRVIRYMDFGRDKDEIRKLGLHLEGPAAAYICRETKCTARIEDPDSLKRALEREAA